MLPHIFRRIVNDSEPRIFKRSVDFIHKHFIDLKNEQPCVGAQPVQNITGHHTVAGTKFHHHTGAGRVNFRRDSPAEKARTGRNAPGRTQVAYAFPQKVEALIKWCVLQNRDNGGRWTEHGRRWMVHGGRYMANGRGYLLLSTLRRTPCTIHRLP